MISINAILSLLLVLVAILLHKFDMALPLKVYEKLLMNNEVIIIKCPKEYNICVTINYVPKNIIYVP